jgi:tetratricopeptide (TPR) repeat protein
MLAQVDPTQAGRLLTETVIAKYEAALAQPGVPQGQRAAQSAAFRDHWRRVNATDAARTLIDQTILRPAIEAIDKQFQNQPLVDAQLRHVLAGLYESLGLYDAAMPLQSRALETRRRLLGNDDPETLSSVVQMGQLLVDKAKLADAEPFLKEGLEGRRRVLGPEHPDTLTSIFSMGVLRQGQGRVQEAMQYYDEALKKRRRVLGEDPPRDHHLHHQHGPAAPGDGQVSRGGTVLSRGAREVPSRVQPGAFLHAGGTE